MMQLTSLMTFSSVISFLGYRLHGIERLVATGQGAVSRAERPGGALFGRRRRLPSLMTAGPETDGTGRSEGAGLGRCSGSRSLASLVDEAYRPHGEGVLVYLRTDEILDSS